MDQFSNLTAIPIDLKHEFNIDYLSKADGKRYRGKFTTKKLSIMDISRVQVRTLQLNGGYHYDNKKPGIGVTESQAMTSNIIAHLEVSLVQAPNWWDLENIIDIELVTHVYEKVSDFETGVDSPLQGAVVDTGSGQEDSGQKSQGSGAVGRSTKMGGGEVLPSMDP